MGPGSPGRGASGSGATSGGAFGTAARRGAGASGSGTAVLSFVSACAIRSVGRPSNSLSSVTSIGVTAAATQVPAIQSCEVTAAAVADATLAIASVRRLRRRSSSRVPVRGDEAIASHHSEPSVVPQRRLRTPGRVRADGRAVDPRSRPGRGRGGAGRPDRGSRGRRRRSLGGGHRGARSRRRARAEPRHRGRGGGRAGGTVDRPHPGPAGGAWGGRRGGEGSPPPPGGETGSGLR